MDRKTLIIGGAAIIIGGAIATNVFLNNPKSDNPFNIPANEEVNDNAAKIEQLYFDSLEDKERYTFCQGREEIRGTYSNQAFGNEQGELEYISDDISVLDKESNKLYILGRRIEYKYSGNGETPSQIGQGTLEIEESGVTTEYYNKNEAPVRIDYNSQLINPAPERKNSGWVAITIKSIGTLMGLTQERVDEETGDAKVFCSSFSLAAGPLKSGALVAPGYFSFGKPCPDNSPAPGVKFSGDFKFECNDVDNKRGIELAKEYQELENLKEEFNTYLEAASDGEEENNEFRDVISDESPEDPGMQQRLQELKDEMQRDAPIR